MARRDISIGSSVGTADIVNAINQANLNFIDLYATAIGDPQGRLTLTANTPVMVASATGSNTIRYTPYKGLLVPLFDGTRFSMVNIGGELSQLTTDTTKSPAAVAATSTYDMFVWDDNGTMRCTRGPAWTNSTTRSMALTRLGGTLVNSAAITNGPALYRGTYVGTVSSNGSSTIDFTFGTAASGGGAAVLNVWNYYNRVQVITRVTDTQTAYTYTLATIRQAGGSAGNQITYTIGVAEDQPVFQYQTVGSTAAAAGANMQTSIGDDSITAFEIAGSYNYTDSVAVTTGTMNCVYAKGMTETTAGLHYAAALEKSDGTNANTFNVGTAAELAGIIRM